MIINQEVLVQVTVTPEKMGELFAEMGADEMAIFFNSVADQVKGWLAPFSFQMEAVIREKNLSDEARKIMGKIGEYSQECRP